MSVDYPRGSRAPRHCHPRAQLLFAQQGTIRALVDEALWVVPTGRALWIPAHTAHELTMLGFVQLRTLYLRDDPRPLGAIGTSVLEVSALLRELVLRTCMLQMLDERRPFDRLLAELLCAELGSAPAHGLLLRLPRDKRARALAERWLDCETPNGTVTDDFARHGLSRRNAERIFARETGVSPARWRRLALLCRGLAKLALGGSVDAAADLAGYAGRSGFHEAFSRTFGCSPAAMRPGANDDQTAQIESGWPDV